MVAQGGWPAAALAISLEFSLEILLRTILNAFPKYLYTFLLLPLTTAVEVTYIFEVSIHVLAPVAGALADWRAGRRRTFLVSAAITSVGASLLAILSLIWRQPGSLHVPIVMVALGLVGVGAAGLKATAAAVGVEQFDSADQASFFFTVMHLPVTVAALVSGTILLWIGVLKALVTSSLVMVTSTFLLVHSRSTFRRGASSEDFPAVGKFSKLLMWCVGAITYWSCFFALQGLTAKQSSFLRRDQRVARKGFCAILLEDHQLQSVLTFSVTAFAFIDHFLVDPLVSRITHRPQGLRPLQRLSLGLTLTTLAMISAALVETGRSRGGTNTCLLWPQLILAGASAAFPHVGALEYFTTESERRRFVSGLYWCMLGIGLLSGRIIIDVGRLLITKGQLSIVYWLLAIPGAIGLLCCIWDPIPTTA